MKFLPRIASLRLRLALAFLGALAVILASTNSFLFWSLRHQLRSIERDILTGRLQVLSQARQRERTDPGEFQEQLHYLAGESILFRFYARSTDAMGTPNTTADPMTQLIPAGIFNELVTGHPHRWISPSGSTYLLETAVVPNPKTMVPEKIQLALDVTGEDAILDAYAKRLILVWLVASLMAALMAALVAHQGLAPITQISRSLAKVTAGDLHKRLEPGDWPAEMSGLVASLNEMLARLDDSFQRLSQFSSELAHELRTPLHALRTQAEVTLQSLREPADYQQALETALEEYERLSRMVENMLFLAKSENSELSFKVEAIDGSKEARLVLDYFEPLIADKSLDPCVEGQAIFYADTGLLRRAMTNIVSNAVKFADPGTKIVINLSVVGEACSFNVTNRGLPIAPAILARLGSRFFRASQDSSKEGLGLGLAIVKSIVKRHGGKMNFVSNLDGLTTIGFEIPDASSLPT